MVRSLTWFAVVWLTMMPCAAQVAISVAPIFSDSMVLQHGMPVTIHGKGEPGTQLTVSFLEQEISTSVGDEGHWEVELKELVPSTLPATLMVASGEDVLVLNDVLVGHVWLCSGQSNMAWALSKCENGEAAIAQANDNLLRVNNFGDQWRLCTGLTASSTSGVAYYFARTLRKLQPTIPVGIIDTSRSGSPIEYWTPVDSLKKIAFCQSTIERFLPSAKEGKAWRAFMALEESWKTDFRNSGRNRKAVGKKPTYDAGYAADVLARIYADNAPGRLWLERIQPWAGFPIAGAVWYQGERNTKAGADCALSYGEMLSAMIESWRAAWGQGDFQFLVVQLPSYSEGGPNWTIVQEQQASAVAKTNNAEYVDIRDLPDDGLHPPNKQPVGERLAAKVNQ